MANVLQLDLIAYFTPVFSLLFVWVISYALLAKTNILGKNNALNIVAATSIAVVFMITSEAVQIVKEIMPWFLLLVVVLVFIFAIFIFLGMEKEFKETIHPMITVWAIIIILAGIFLFAATKVFGNPIQSIYAGEAAAEAGVMGSIGKIIFHPKVLGAVLLLLLLGQAIKLIVNAYRT